jgi:hypothetical protein
MMSILWTAIQLLLSGFFVNFIDVYNYWLTYLRYVSACYYSFEAACINEFKGAIFKCGNQLTFGDSGMISNINEAFPNASPKETEAATALFQARNPACVLDSTAILTYFRFSRPYWESIVILFSYLFICHILTFIAMLMAARRERR